LGRPSPHRICGHGKACLAAGLSPWVASPSKPANLKGAVPFFEPPPACETMAVREEELSELGRQIAVDLKTDAYFDEGGSGPGHGVSSYDRPQRAAIRQNPYMQISAYL
jgi:hypothetical protein